MATTGSSRPIGKGNLATMKLAWHTLTGKEVAVQMVDKMEWDSFRLQRLYENHVLPCMQLHGAWEDSVQWKMEVCKLLPRSITALPRLLKALPSKQTDKFKL